MKSVTDPMRIQEATQRHAASKHRVQRGNDLGWNIYVFIEIYYIRIYIYLPQRLGVLVHHMYIHIYIYICIFRGFNGLLYPAFATYVCTIKVQGAFRNMSVYIHIYI